MRTSHSLSRFGYCCSESSLRGTSPEPALAAVPSTVREHPTSMVTAASTAAIPATIRRTEPAHFALDDRLTGQFLGHVARIGGKGFSAKLIDHSMKSSSYWMPISHRLLPRVGSVAERDEPVVAFDVDVLDAGARQFLGLAFTTDRAAAVPGEREMRAEDAAAGQPLAADGVARGVDQSRSPGSARPSSRR